MGRKSERSPGWTALPFDVRVACREAFSEALDAIRSIASGNSDGSATQLRAFELLGKYGFGEADSVWLENGEWMRVVSDVTARYLGDMSKYDAWSRDVHEALSSLK